MLKIFLWIIVGLLVASGLAWLMLRDPGYILLSYNNVSIESNLWAGLIALLLALTLGYYLVKFLFRLRYSGRDMKHWWSGRQSRRSEQQITQGLIHYIEGDWKRAQKTFGRDADKAKTPLLNYLMAARASEAMGDLETCNDYLHKAETSTPDAEIAIGLTQAEVQLNSRQYENCLATLNKIRESAPEHPAASRMLSEVLSKLEDWSGLQALLPQLQKHRSLSDTDYAQLEEQVYLNTLASPESLASLQAQWQSLPRKAQQNAELVEAYAKGLIAQQASGEAEKVLRSAIKRNWSDNLVKLYGRVQGDNPQKQLSTAEGWVKDHGNSAELLLSLGRLSLMNKLWGKAREYFNASLSMAPNAEAFGELGRLLSHMGEHSQSNRSYEQGLLLLTSDLPELPQPAPTPETTPALPAS